MCGIVGCIGKIDVRDYLMEGLYALDYRGNDSAGIAFIENEKIEVSKYHGPIANLDSNTKRNLETNIGIGHTRWATHGVPNDLNAHPHLSNSKQFALAHNGSIENYKEFKNKLIGHGFSFLSETDSEVIVNLIEFYYRETPDILKVLNRIEKEMHGSYAIALLNNNEPNKIFFLKKQSPLIVGICEGVTLLASDAAPMIKKTGKFIDLEDGQYGYIEENGYQIFKNNQKSEAVFSKKEAELLTRNLDGYPHFMLKEIEEITKALMRLVGNYYVDNHYQFDLELLKEIAEAETIVFVACGTSYHASLVGARYFESIGKNAHVYIASEFAYYPKKSNQKTFYIMLSQSGETADLVKCQKLLQCEGKDILVITNTKGSILERNAKYSLLLYAGLEVAVASTKAYASMVALLALLIGGLKQNPQIVKDLKRCMEIISHLNEQKEETHQLALKIKDASSLFYLGRGYDYDLALEASLKLKEATYIHSEAFPGGELKHGPIALITDDIPVIIFISDPHTAEVMRSNAKEVESRGAKVFVISSENLKDPDDAIVVADCPIYLAPLVKCTIGFYIAYYVALEKGLNVDKPRNLAKAVTV